MMDETGSDLPEYMEVARDSEPWMYRLPKLSHYYGDFVRQCFVAAAATMLLTAPFYVDDTRVFLPFAIVGALVLVGAAAMTSPWNKTVIVADAVIAGVGLVIFELWALGEYGMVPMVAFLIRQVIAIIFMFAFYFSMKTLRSQLLKQIGKPDVVMDAERRGHPTETDEVKAAVMMAEKRKHWKDQATYERREYDG